MREVKINSLYKHFKGHTYKVIAIGFNSETYDERNPLKSKMVVYQNIDTNETWIRPYDVFVSEVDHDKYPDVKQKYRFEEI